MSEVNVENVFRKKAQEAQAEVARLRDELQLAIGVLKGVQEAYERLREEAEAARASAVTSPTEGTSSGVPAEAVPATGESDS